MPSPSAPGWAESLRFLQVEPTTRCNFTCGFCCGRSLEQGDLPLEVLERALEQLPALEHVELQGEGEPLLHPRFFELLARVRARGVRVSLITNGTLLDTSAVATLLELGVERVALSLETADPERFQRLRGGALSKSVAGLRRLREERDRRGLRRPTLGLALTALRSTRDDLAGVSALYRELQLDGGVAVQALNRMEDYYRHYDAELRAELLPGQAAAALEAALPAPAPDAAPGFFGELFAGFDPAAGRCPWVERGAFLARDGSLTPCCMVKDARRFGWRGLEQAPDPRRAALRRGLAEGPTPEPCRGCGIAEQLARARAPQASEAPLALLELLGELEGQSVLAVGCGEGAWCAALLERAPTAEVWGVDPAPELLARAPRGVRVQVAAADRLPFPAARFAATCAAGPLAADPARREAELAELCRVTVPGGSVLVPGARLEVKDALARRCRAVRRAPPNPAGPAWLAVR